MKRVAFAHIGDTHITPGAPHLARVEQLFLHIQSQQHLLDFVVHVGDVAGHNRLDSCGAAEDYLLFNQYSSVLSVPLYPVAGNHDDPRLLSVPPTARMLVGDPCRCSYQFDHGSLRGVVLDARTGTGPESCLPQDQLRALRKVLGSVTGPICLFTHFPPVPLGTNWLDDLMIMKNGAEFHTLLAKQPHTVAGVFVGHVHVPFTATSDGVLYVGCGSPAWAFSLAPGPSPFQKVDHGPVVWNLVTVGDEGVVVRPQVVPNSGNPQ